MLVIGTLNDEDSTTASVSFDVTIGPDCDNDMITYSTTLGHQDYTLGINQPNVLSLSPATTQSVPNCPVFCEVTATSPFDFLPIFSFNDENGDLVIKTQQGYLNDRTYNYAIECYSEYSQIMNSETPAIESFTVGFSFEDCNSQIILPQDYMSDKMQYWGVGATTTAPVSAYSYTASCMLEFSYSALVNDGSGTFVPVENIREISFDPIARTFTLEKCGSPEAIQADPDCSGLPFFITYEVAVIASLNDGYGSFNSDMMFDVTFAPDCRADTITFNNPFDASYSHLITSPPTSETLDPMMMQSTANCPITCDIDTDGITDDALSFNSATGAVTINQFNYM